MTKRPFENTALVKYVERRVLELKPKKSQLQIASEAGFVHPNMVSMIKSGASKLALDRVPSMAAALEFDPAYLMRLALEQSLGSTSTKAVLEVFGTPVRANERGWLEEFREASDNTDPRLTRTALQEMFGK